MAPAPAPHARDRGATAVEYGLAIALVAIVIAAAVTLLGTRLSGVITSAGCAVARVANANANANPTSCASPAAIPISLTSPSGGSAYWIGTPAWSTADMVVSGVLTLGGTASGPRGYGVVVRGTGLTAAGLQSGYTFQVDPGLNGFVLRGWSGGGEFQVGATAAFPPGFNPATPQQVQVSVVGNRLTATVAGQQVMEVADLRAATATGRGAAGFVMPPGTQYGIRAWWGSTVSSTGLTVA